MIFNSMVGKDSMEDLPTGGRVKIKGMVDKKRVDQALVTRGLVKDLETAKRLIMAGKVRHREQVVMKASQKVADQDELTLIQEPKFASRGGEKLQAAFDYFSVSVQDQICADLGASTGGFTDCLLQHGASKVYAVDVGYGILDWRLRNDPRVIVMERTNARSIASLPEPIDFITAEVFCNAIDGHVLLPYEYQLSASSKKSEQCLMSKSSNLFDSAKYFFSQPPIVFCSLGSLQSPAIIHKNCYYLQEYMLIGNALPPVPQMSIYL